MAGISLMPSAILEGRWKKHRYKVKSKLGQGGIACVYLVVDVNTGRDYAIKISKDSISINREYELLKKFHKVDMIVKAYEIDDIRVEGEIYYYILLEYIQGDNLKNYINKNKLDACTIISIILLLLKGLQVFYDEEYILGDLKPENIMVDQKANKIKIIDLGGLLKLGDPIKEFTPAYDRAAWKCGKRLAEPSYQLFTLLMILIKLLTGDSLNPKKQEIEDVIGRIKKLELDKDLESFIIMGLANEYNSINLFARKLETLYYQEKANQKRKKLLLKEKKINAFLCFSIIFFVLTMAFIFLL